MGVYLGTVAFAPLSQGFKIVLKPMIIMYHAQQGFATIVAKLIMQHLSTHPSQVFGILFSKNWNTVAFVQLSDANHGITGVFRSGLAGDCTRVSSVPGRYVGRCGTPYWGSQTIFKWLSCHGTSAFFVFGIHVPLVLQFLPVSF
jgi:hypothetical protein